MFWFAAGLCIIYPKQIEADEPQENPPFNYFLDMLDQHQRGIGAGFLQIHRVNIASLLNYQLPGRRFDSLRPAFIFVPWGVPDLLSTLPLFRLLP